MRKERSYYTDFAKLAPSDSVILTLACGKYRFNDFESGQRSAASRACWTSASATTPTVPSRSRSRWRMLSVAV